MHQIIQKIANRWCYAVNIIDIVFNIIYNTFFNIWSERLKKIIDFKNSFKDKI